MLKVAKVTLLLTESLFEILRFISRRLTSLTSHRNSTPAVRDTSINAEDR